MGDNKKFQRFGKYLILDHLVDGGMAKICRARYLGEQANKVVAIKMVQPQFSNDEAFVRMFQDELNITFGMLHPNIMQVYDYGKTNGQLYTAMEYIHGANLKQYLDRLTEKKLVFPVEASCYIISQVCLGLHYAHTFTDKLTGKPFNIVHRDISPHNIMLTYDGAVKVIDFGIAKANTNSEATQAGTIKGKLSYLAPEYLEGMELDARYDEFAVGITLWELLCGKKLFQASNDLAVLKQIQACKIDKPSKINPRVPKDLDDIVMKALSKDRANRYENLDQMNRALVRFLYAHYPDFNASDLKSFAADLFNLEIERDQQKFVEYGSIDVQAYIEDMKREETKVGKGSKKEKEVALDPQERRKRMELDLAVDASQVTGIEIDTGIRTKKLSKAALQAKAEAGKASSKGTSSSGSVKKASTSGRVSSRKESQNTSSSSSGGLVAGVFAAAILGFAYLQADMVEEFTGFNLRKMISGEEASRSISSVPKPGSVDQATKPAEASRRVQTGEIVLQGVDVEMEIYLNGNKQEYVGKPLMTQINKELTLVVKKPGYSPHLQKIRLSEQENIKTIVIPELARARTGLLTVSQNFTAGSKIIYEEHGQVIERDLPFTDIKVAEGTYQAKIVNPILGTEKKVEFTIEENKKFFLDFK